MDLYYEQNVPNKNVDERTKRTKTLLIAKTVCLVFALASIMGSAMFGDYFFDVFWIFLLFAIPFFVAAYVLGKINKRNNTEYDYVLDDEFLRISEIYFREQRKLKHTVRLRFVESVGMFGSEGYKKVEHNVNKKILALVNYDDEDAIMYICYKTDKGERKILFLEPNRGFVMTLRRALSSVAITVFDKSISDLEKHLAQIEQEEALLEEEDDEADDEMHEEDTQEIIENGDNITTDQKEDNAEIGEDA